MTGGIFFLVVQIDKMPQESGICRESGVGESQAGWHLKPPPKWRLMLISVVSFVFTRDFDGEVLVITWSWHYRGGD
jgi:hypothetical protein